MDDTFEPTDQPNIYRDLIGSGDFTFELLDSVHQGEAIPHIILKVTMRITTTEIILLPIVPHIILFHYGQNEVSILEFTESAAYHGRWKPVRT